jgi:hypothetical protein
VPCPDRLSVRPADRDDFVNVAPKLSLSYDLRGRNVYASVSRGFRPPEITDCTSCNGQDVTDLDSERLDAVQLGIKTSYASGAHRCRRSTWARRRDPARLERLQRQQRTGIARDRIRALVGAARRGGSARPALRHRYEFSRAVDGGETIVDGNDIDTAAQLHNFWLRWQPAVVQRSRVARGWQVFRRRRERADYPASC